MSVSAITLNKPSLSYKHLKSGLMPCILLQSPVESPQFTKHLSCMNPKGNTQLQTIKWLVSLISSLYLSFSLSDLFRYLSMNSTRCPTEKTLKEIVQFFKTTMIFPSTVPIPNVKLEIVSKVYHMLYNNSTGENTM